MSGHLTFVFGPFELDPARRRLTAAGEPVAISDRQLEVLGVLVARAGQIVAKDELLDAAWKDVAVGDNSLEQAISSLRRILAAHSEAPAIETAARRGYRFSLPVTRRAARETDAGLDALLAPHRAFVEGRAALETLEAGEITRARTVFEEAVRLAPDHASSHIGIANASVMQFEMTRADPAPDLAALTLAAGHAREACRLAPESGEAWATLGFVLARSGHATDGVAAAKRAITLEPDNWRHFCRLAYGSWGEERLRAAQRTLALLPGFPLAHWLAATVHVARQAVAQAERELEAGLRAESGAGDSRFSSVALHWLQGLVCLGRGDERRALEEFHRELALEHSGNLYARECCANTWYAIGAVELRRGNRPGAQAAFEQALSRVTRHVLARVGLAAATAHVQDSTTSPGDGVASTGVSVEDVLARAAQLTARGDHAEAATLVGMALGQAPPGSAGWLLPLEPLLNVSAQPQAWAAVLALVRKRAA